MAKEAEGFGVGYGNEVSFPTGHIDAAGNVYLAGTAKIVERILTSSPGDVQSTLQGPIEIIYLDSSTGCK